MEENQIMAIWDMFLEYIPEKNRAMAANQYIDFLLGSDVSLSSLQLYTGYDEYLDNAIELVTSEVSDEFDEDNFDNEDY